MLDSFVLDKKNKVLCEELSADKPELNKKNWLQRALERIEKTSLSFLERVKQ